MKTHYGLCCNPPKDLLVIAWFVPHFSTEEMEYFVAIAKGESPVKPLSLMQDRSSSSNRYGRKRSASPPMKYSGRYANDRDRHRDRRLVP